MMVIVYPLHYLDFKNLYINIIINTIQTPDVFRIILLVCSFQETSSA